MCLILFAHRVHPIYPLIVAANRDEFYNRPTKEAHFWDDHPDILAGRDLKQMGTWMGVTTTGRFAALTNYRELVELDINKQSRGEIVSNFLAGSDCSSHYLQTLAKKKEQYEGFNIIVGDRNELWYYSNRTNEPIKLEPGIYGLGNSLINTPWPKVVIGKQLFQNAISERMVDQEQLFEALANVEQPTDNLLPNTGVGEEWERKLAPLFIKTENYGTRASTVLTVSNDGNVIFTERTFKKETSFEKKFEFQIKKK
ncbi:NRDE family protein [Bacillus taeanensis]|uniref:NRDE family protein n=1 Tax=Bacillus taeanensis TaxID=273032 RepID=A0A366XU57_9BACI|nr:NRDE family protein [Bacillus taeanensis]RBW69437.1 hypothetical protein DS031_10965 [Bacillus taeanensis]